MPLEFPYDTLKPTSFRLDIVGSVVVGGQTQSGQQQRVNATGGGLWGLALEFNTLRTRNQVMAWRALQYGQHGGVIPVNISVCDIRHSPRSFSIGGVPHSDGSPFSDTSLYAGPDVVAVLTADAASGTTLSIAFDEDAELIGGEYFSMRYGDNRHELHAITSAVATDDGYDITFVPPLRAAHVIGDEVTFGHPKCTFVLSQPDAMSMNTRLGKFGDNPSAVFVEYLGA
jgi:hypothetical protein